MDQDQAKKASARAALDFIEADTILGVGTGTTSNYFIAALKEIKNKIEGVVASSVATANQLKALSFPLLDLNSVTELALYVDGADEVNMRKQMIKGGGGALTREKIVATMAKRFICIVDETKVVDLLGTFPIAVEVIPMARSYVAREIVRLGGDPVYREGFITDNSNVILDVYNMKLLEPRSIEEKLKNIVGVVENGIFAKRTADILLVGREEKVEQF